MIKVDESDPVGGKFFMNFYLNKKRNVFGWIKK